MKFVVITGVSGAGKSLTVKFMEDLGFYCVDNLPPALIPKFAELCDKKRGMVGQIAMVMDIRGGLFFEDLFPSLTAFRKLGYEYDILFLDASDDVLIKRFKETRRVHPLSQNGSIEQGLKKEREELQSIREMASTILDTSRLTPGQLKEELRHIYQEGDSDNYFLLNITSFGFKYGIPLDADLVMDVRFLQNPYYDHRLRDLTGKDSEVQEYVMKDSNATTFVEKLEDMLRFLLPNYMKEGKHQLVLAIGCTGGKHRSVTMALELENRLQKGDFRTIVNHRDID
ncbi:UPF0042 nucleotide-binding protein [Tindallia magadiensis]|uniref:UPF0042 nucleotide-binding protein n=1 Tax=Tindallia magadiensis TaxID=69895 RepID=A0A1I3F5T3_9FIRM|nr:RNase adapter RapZ [Tindallia magadiensis]SFI06564.1 UPF0042 nucleotide-binding protein [Tindallia magadiensis]